MIQRQSDSQKYSSGLSPQGRILYLQAMAAPLKEPSRILVVEDDVDISSMLGKILEENGYVVHSATGGASAVALLKSVMPDLVLLDLQVPEKTGFEVLKEI